MYKRLLALVLVLGLAIGVTACGTSNQASSPEQAKDQKQAEQSSEVKNDSDKQEKTASDFPNKPIKLIVPWSAGGGTDAVARALAQTGEKYLGTTVIVENKPGGSGAVGLGEVMAAKPDGYTLAILPVELGFLDKQGIYPFSFDNFTRIMNLNTDPSALTVKADAPWNTLGEFIEYAKKNPGKVKIGNSGTGVLWHLAAASLERSAGIKVTHVPFDGAAPAIAAVLGKQIDAVTVSGAEVSAQVKAGEMKVLAVLGEQRLDVFPDVPTAKEEGIDVNINTFRGLGGPADIPEDRVKILHDGFKKMMEDPAFTDVMKKMGLGIDYRNTENYIKLTDDTAQALEPVLKDLGLYKK
ncbi:tripartite tricarboxylate transporter substrate binding protein [Petroclostridium sp. X23]|uniref:tripartite tricarboxylate transporter substrate binding protein n=1 Tax=Petroclostridium sp. X23 TaxID=3045146 RepID=UPI0024ACB85B|nr:tripartite tricarboxylate transporter substrate binding protein [Petroclostridium sp. X23]WHH58028.1 tripartite tricarboxylate transporter substrate binding protein [Petroclostridium sp. X23]